MLDSVKILRKIVVSDTHFYTNYSKSREINMIITKENNHGTIINKCFLHFPFHLSCLCLSNNQQFHTNFSLSLRDYLSIKGKYY